MFPCQLLLGWSASQRLSEFRMGAELTTGGSPQQSPSGTLFHWAAKLSLHLGYLGGSITILCRPFRSTDNDELARQLIKRSDQSNYV